MRKEKIDFLQWLEGHLAETFAEKYATALILINPSLPAI